MKRTWLELRQSLVNSGQLHEVFTKFLDSKWTSDPDKRYEPLVISEHFARLADLIDRCLSIRKEIRDLEILAVKSSAEYEIFVKTSLIDEEMEKIRLFEESRKLERQGHSTAAAAFGNETSLERGFAAISLGREKALSEEVQRSQQLFELIGRRWSEVRAFQAAYRERFMEPGNAHNYGERATNLIRILGLQVAEALARSNALQVGMQSIYSWNAPSLPEQIGLDNLDDLAIWILKIRQEWAWRNENEAIYDQVVPLVQPWLGPGASLIQQEVFDTAIASDSTPVVLKFSVDKQVFFGKEVRLKGIGVSFGNKFGLIPSSGIDSIQTADSFARLSVDIKTPSQKYPAGLDYQRPNISLGNVSLHQSGQPVAYYEGSCIENLNPFGKWELQIHPWIVWKDASEQRLSAGVLREKVRDVKVLFRVYSPTK